MVLPVVKLLALTVKTVSKPIAKSVQRTVISHPGVRDWVLEATQWYYKINVNISRRLYSDGKVRKPCKQPFKSCNSRFNQ